MSIQNKTWASELTGIGSQQVTVEQWYAAIAGYLTKGFQLSINIGQWWRSQSTAIATNSSSPVWPDQPAAWVDQLVETGILTDWEVHDEPEHLKTIRDRIWF
ncbi:MAG: hypothetical protein ACTS2F_16910 [Thainema sp.]